MGEASLRIALWRANGCRCFYCQEPIASRDLEIDHIIPRSSEPTELRRYVDKLGFEEDFKMECIRNKVPSHHDCNRRKSDSRFSENALRFYFETWTKKQVAVSEELAKLEVEAVSSNVLSALTFQMEKGLVSPEEVIAIVRSASPQRTEPHEPWVITFGCNVHEVIQQSAVPAEAPKKYPDLCDWLEHRLLHYLSEHLSAVVTETEASYRDGELLSVRIAAWHVDFEELGCLELPLWGVLEVNRYSEVYDHSWQDDFVQAVVRTYHDVITDKRELFGFRFCPQCGSKELKQSEHLHSIRDEAYCVIVCNRCGWSDWTQ